MARFRVSVPVKPTQVSGAKLHTVTPCLGPYTGLPAPPTHTRNPFLPYQPAPVLPALL